MGEIKNLETEQLGRILLTRGVNDRMAEDELFPRFVWQSLSRHARGDWGDLDEEDKIANQYALDKHLRIFSAYEREGLPEIWIITEADRSATTVLFPDEY
jgi:hypothetical protein